MAFLGERELVLYCLNDSDDYKDIYSVSNTTKYNAYYNNANYNNTNYEGKKWDQLTHFIMKTKLEKLFKKEVIQVIIAQQLLHHLPKKLTYANFIGLKAFIINIKVIFYKTILKDKVWLIIYDS